MLSSQALGWSISTSITTFASTRIPASATFATIGSNNPKKSLGNLTSRTSRSTWGLSAITSRNASKIWRRPECRSRLSSTALSGIRSSAIKTSSGSKTTTTGSSSSSQICSRSTSWTYKFTARFRARESEARQCENSKYVQLLIRWPFYMTSIADTQTAS